MSLCPYKNIFGAPRTGAHRFRVFDFAIADIVATAVGAYGISSITGIGFFTALVVLFILGVIAHRVFCVRTTVDKMLFPIAK